MDTHWDAVLIATPAHTHISIALQVALHGQNLLIEKPLSTSLEGITELQHTVKKKNLLAAVSYNYRAHPGFRAMKTAIDSGKFGKPLQFYVVAGQNFSTYRPAYRDIYFADRSKGGGAVQDALTHSLNIGEWFLGPIDRITVDAAHQLLEGVTVEDTVHVLTRQGSVMGSYTLNLYQQPNESTLTLVCEKGTLRFELHKECFRWMDTPEGIWHEEPHTLEGRDTWYILNAAFFLDTLEGKMEPLCSLDDGIQTLRVNLAALAAMESQQWQQIKGGVDAGS
ncbi:MAG: Gfo/Idh/MocA family oxidoreductase [Candidatus Hydrogenedentes bacterium]|nr:Gfo/Idh/MocA family oxidoreductase [Candidatus Hydrogenedentota bacterium]